MQVGALPPGAVVELSASQKKRAKEHAKKEAEKARAAAEAEALAALKAASLSAAAPVPEPPADPEKAAAALRKKLEKKLRQIDELLESSRSGAVTLNDEQRAKVAGRAALQQELDALGRSAP